MKQSKARAINVVAGLIFRGGRLLVCQRNVSADFPLKWEFPGGKVEGNESDLEALRRELKEELDIEMRDAVLAWTHKHTYRDGPTVALRFYNVRMFDGEAKNMVFEQICWLEPSTLEELDFLDGDLPLIHHLTAGRAKELLDR
jgi:8-oxo-dGTP diphosphatase